MGWQDTKSGDWITSWGESSESEWLERELDLRPGSYSLRSLGENLSFRSPAYDEFNELFLYDLTDSRSGVTRKVVIGEISNGIYAVGYWRGQE